MFILHFFCEALWDVSTIERSNVNKVTEIGCEKIQSGVSVRVDFCECCVCVCVRVCVRVCACACGMLLCHCYLWSASHKSVSSSLSSIYTIIQWSSAPNGPHRSAVCEEQRCHGAPLLTCTSATNPNASYTLPAVITLQITHTLSNRISQNVSYTLIQFKDCSSTITWYMKCYLLLVKVRK